MRLTQRIRRCAFPLSWRVNRWGCPDVWAGGPPAGLFSEQTQVRNTLVGGKIVTNCRKVPDIPINSEVRVANLHQADYTDWVTLWSRRDNAFLAGPSLAHIDSSGRVCLEAIYGPHGWSDPVWRRKEKRPVRELAGNYTSIVSRWNDGKNFYHWFLDGLTRLVHLSDFPVDCRILIPRNPPSFAKRSIELLGLADHVVEVADDDLRIERYWFAGPTMLSGCPDPLGTDWLLTKFMPEAAPTPHRRLYVERNSITRNLTNAREIRNWFVNRGWDVVEPGDMTLDAQISLFSEARAVAGPHGAAMTNLLWTAPGTRILEFMPSRRRNGCYAGISLVKGLHHQSLVCPSDRDGVMGVSLDQLAAAVNRIELDF